MIAACGATFSKAVFIDITDAPQFGWRGMMIDDVRHFFGKAAMRRTLDLLFREGDAAAPKAGLDCVMTPRRFCYFNYEQGLAHDPVVYPWWSYPIPLEKAYGYDPLAGIPPAAQKHVLGGQCCLWANKIPDEPQLQWQTWPRACATAEVFWSPASCRDFAGFIRRMRIHRLRLLDRRVNCAPFGEEESCEM